MCVCVCVCLKDELGGFTCQCVTGWTGTTCDVNIDDCDPDPCLNGANCMVSLQQSLLGTLSNLKFKIRFIHLSLFARISAKDKSHFLIMLCFVWS